MLGALEDPGIWWLIAFRGILGFGIGGDYPVSATIMSECASWHDRGRMVALVFSMQGADLVIGPLVAIGLLRAGLRPDLAWRVLLALPAVPPLAVFWLRRRLRETVNAEDPAYEEEMCRYSYPDPPYKPDPPHYFAVRCDG